MDMVLRDDAATAIERLLQLIEYMEAANGHQPFSARSTLANAREIIVELRADARA